MNRQRFSVSKTSITTQIHQPFDTDGNLTAKLAFNLDLTIDHFTDVIDFSFGELFDSFVWVDLQLIKNLF